MKLQTLAAFYPTYNKPDRVYHVLRHFRKHYPTATVHLVADGGCNLAAVAWQFGCIYHHEPHIGFAVKCSEAVMASWMRRLLVACEQSSEEWVLMLEDDVLVRALIDVPEYALAGADMGPHALFDMPLAKAIRARHPHLVNLGFGGGGGTMLNRQKAVNSIAAYLQGCDFGEWTKGLGCRLSDAWLTVMFWNCGYQTGPNKDLAETRRNPDWRTSHHAIVHQPPVSELEKD